MSEGGPEKAVATVTITIDGRRIETEAGRPLLQVALDHGIEIPHYCYHPKLSIDGSCRLCQVKIERAPKLAISCNTPVADGMVVDTRCEEVAEARRGVLELLLLNHPLDCPICDQAGECFLQDYAFGFGRPHARTSSPRRKGLKRYPIGSRVVFDEERCILCRRCVRFTKEISKTGELRVFGIGDHSHIATLPGAPLENDYSVCTADICPVGALLSRDFHHKRRVWFLEEVESVCPSCSNGCNIKIGVFRNEIQRLVPRRNDEVNDTWMCDHGRLRYRFVHDETRLREAAIRGGENGAGNGSQPVPGASEALDEAGRRIREVVAEHGGEAVALLVSGHLTNEEYFRLVQLREAIGTPHLDLVVPRGPADGFLIREEKAANGRGAREMGVAPGEGGKDLQGILASCAAGEIRLLYVVGSGDLEAVAGEERVAEATAGVATLVVHDTSRSASSERAAIAIPGLTWAEKDGTFTNHAGRVQRIRRAVEPPPGALAEGAAFVRLASLVRGEAGAAATFDAGSTLAEIAAALPAYQGLSLDSLGGRGRLCAAGAAPSEGAA